MPECLDSLPRSLAVAIIAAVLLSAAQARGDCTFYVRAGFVPAEGPPDGRTPASAFARVLDGVAAASNPGDVVCVGPGLYTEGNVTLGQNGAPGGPDMTFPIEIHADPTGVDTGDPPGPVRMVPPQGLPVEQTPTTAFLILGRHDVVIEGFEMSGFTDAGIQVRSAVTGGANSADITLRHNRITGCRVGIDINGEGVMVVEENAAIGNTESGIVLQACSQTTDFGLCRGAVSEPIVPIVSNNQVGGNGAQGIFVRTAEGGVIQNNVIYSNAFAGITLRETNDVLVANNLVYANGQEGIAVGSADLPAPGTLVLNNTLYGNGQWGVEIGSGNGASPRSAVVNNIIWRNGQGRNGIGVLNEAQFDMTSGALVRRQTSTCGYVAGFNLALDEYGPDTPRNAYDFRGDPLFVNANGADGVLGGEIVDGQFVDRSADDDFHLMQSGATRSPALDGGSAAVSQIGLTGSTAPSGTPDAGLVDVGFHYGASAAQVLTYTAPFMPLYVRSDGDDRNDGLSPTDAFASIGTAARRARAGITVVVGPGRYNECDINPPPYSGRAAFIADQSGALTVQQPGVVLVDAGKCSFDVPTQHYVPGETGFNIPNVCDVVIDGFHITGATDDGVQLQNFSDRAVLRNIVAFQNVRRGINVVNAEDVHIVNNLTFGNGGGIQVGGSCRMTALCPTGMAPPAGARRAVIEHNTAYGNTHDGILIGTGEGISSGATVRYNITGENGDHGFEVGDNSTREANLVDYVAAYNATAATDLRKADGYAVGTPRGTGDLMLDLRYEPLLVDPTAIHLDGDWLVDQSFRLVQRAAGQDRQSRAVDYADVSADKAGMAQLSTRTDAQADDGILDLGYHYPRRAAGAFGDCNGDGRVTISELIAMVNVALGNSPLAACPAADANSDGAVGINELIAAVNTVLQAPQ